LTANPAPANNPTMRTEGDRESDNVEDQRGMMGGRGGIVAGGGVGTIIIALIVYFLGGNPRAVLQNAGPGSGGAPSGQFAPPPDKTTEDKLTKFVRVVLADTEDVWTAQLPRQTGKQYRLPKMVLFTGQVQSACGMASTASGPFYCPGDEKLYIDLAFYNELARRFKAPGDFAEAYVIAHEVGHHVQKILGITDAVDSQRARLSKSEYNKLSVRLELQADFLAGVWAHHAQKMKNILEPGDVEEALRAASAVGDDSIQKQSQGYVVPDSFTHGSSAQRMAWFKKGFETGDVSQGDTFRMADPR
jgi:predicted metalloprotease